MTWTKEEHEAAKAGKSLDALDISEMLTEIERGWAEIERLHDAVCHAQSDEIERLKGLVDGLEAKLAERTAEREEARDWVRRLTREQRVLTCAFCGAEYPPGTPASNDDALTAHVRACPKHPMRESEREIERLTGELAAVQASRPTLTEAEAQRIAEDIARGWRTPYGGLARDIAAALLRVSCGVTVAQMRILTAARAWYEAASLGCPRDCPVDEKERRIGRAEQELSDAVRDAHHAHRDAMFAKLTAINGRGPNVSAVEGGPILVPPPERRPDSPPSSDPLAGLPAEEQARILAAAERARADTGLRTAAPWAGEHAYAATIAREVAAYHARLPVNSIGTCSRCGYYGPGPAHDCPALTPAEQAEIIASAPGQIGSGQTPIGRASARPASTELLARQAAAILSEDEHAEEETRAGIEQLNREIKP